jgi:hypothetical protein
MQKEVGGLTWWAVQTRLQKAGKKPGGAAAAIVCGPDSNGCRVAPVLQAAGGSV